VRAGFEFEARLRLELREAAERAQRRGRLARFVAAGRSLLAGVGRSALPAAAVTAGIAAAIAVAVAFMTSGTEQRPVAPPKVVAKLTVADTLGSALAASGSVWMNDTTRNELLRVEPVSRRVSARLPVRGEVTLARGAGALWALQEGSHRGGFELHGPLLRIDPNTNRVTARVPLRTPEGQPFAGFEVLAGPDYVWVGGASGALRVDPRTNRVTLAVVPPDKLVGSDFALSRGGLWAITADGRLLRFDTRTGETVSNVRVALPRAVDLSGGPGDALIATLAGGLARVDPYDGRVAWRTRLGGRVNAWIGAGGLIWARSSGQVHDRLSALDPDTGRVLTTVELDDFSGSGIAAIDDELWLSTVGGDVVVLRR
jgi:putative pyrroloquinoline-quinone binding quinoprotein